MHIDPKKQTKLENYRLLLSCVVPRPIAWVTSCNEEGVVNAAPYSFFNAVASHPPILMISCGRPAEGRKDTARNIAKSKEFVVHIVDERHAEAMNATALHFPSQQSETEAVGLTTIPGSVVSVPRIATAPIQMECRLQQIVGIPGAEADPQVELFLGEVVAFHIEDGLYQKQQGLVDFQALQVVGRLSGDDYLRRGEVFSFPRSSCDKWKGKQGAPCPE